MSWSVVKYHDSVHVIPNNDIDDHYVENCTCGVRYEDGAYIHMAFDMRHILEQIEVDGWC